MIYTLALAISAPAAAGQRPVPPLPPAPNGCTVDVARSNPVCPDVSAGCVVPTQCARAYHLKEEIDPVRTSAPFVFSPPSTPRATPS
eukprot:gene11055-9650_t